MAKVSRLHIEENPVNNRRTTIKRFLHSYAHRSISLSDLAENLYLSESRTSHVVKDLFGKSFRELVIEERVMRAKVMLQSRDEPVALIARDVGFPDEFHFNRMFKKIVGTPPGKFRRAIKRDIS